MERFTRAGTGAAAGGPHDHERRGARDDLTRQLAELRPGDHLCVFYVSDDEGLGALAPYLRDGLARGERCLCVVGEEGSEPVSPG